MKLKDLAPGDPPKPPPSLQETDAQIARWKARQKTGMVEGACEGKHNVICFKCYGMIVHNCSCPVGRWCMCPRQEEKENKDGPEESQSS